MSARKALPSLLQGKLDFYRKRKQLLYHGGHDTTRAVIIHPIITMTECMKKVAWHGNHGRACTAARDCTAGKVCIGTRAHAAANFLYGWKGLYC